MKVFPLPEMDPAGENLPAPNRYLYNPEWATIKSLPFTIQLSPAVNGGQLA